MPTLRIWRSDGPELAFYKTYTLLAANIPRHTDEEVPLVIDRRSDRYGKHLAVMTKIAINFLDRDLLVGRVKAVVPQDSRSSLFLQMADVLIGAITADTNALLVGGAQISEGKQSLIRHVGSLVGWDRLCYDTMPGRNFNVWHFPVEFRAVPETRAGRRGVFAR